MVESPKNCGKTVGSKYCQRVWAPVGSHQNFVDARLHNRSPVPPVFSPTFTFFIILILSFGIVPQEFQPESPPFKEISTKISELVI